MTTQLTPITTTIETTQATETLSTVLVTTIAADEGFHWTKDAITLLIRFRLELNTDFLNPRCKKQSLWHKIAHNLEINGYQVAAPLCDAKWRNLLATYRKNKDRKQTTGEECIKWEYFDIMDDVLGKQTLIEQQPPVGTFVVSLIHTNSDGTPISTETASVVPAVSSDLTEFVETCLGTVTTTDPSVYAVAATDDGFHWTRDAINLLIKLRLNYDSEFLRPQCKKQKLWQKIAQAMRASGGYHLKASACDNKWRNLLVTYRKNKDRNSVKWEFFDALDKVLGKRACIEPPVGSLASSIEPSTSTALTQVDNIENNTLKRRRADEPPAWFKKFMDERKADERARRVAEEQRWEQQRDMELQKIAAVNALADVIRNLCDRS